MSIDLTHTHTHACWNEVFSITKLAKKLLLNNNNNNNNNNNTTTLVNNKNERETQEC